MWDYNDAWNTTKCNVKVTWDRSFEMVSDQ